MQGNCRLRADSTLAGWHGDQAESVEEMRRAVTSDQHVENVHVGVTVVVEIEIHRRRVGEGALVVSDSQHIKSVDLGAGGRVARFAYRVAELENIRFGQPGVGGGQNRHL